MKLEDLKPGDVLLCPPIPLKKKTKNWIGWAIILLTGGEVSHSAIYCGEKEGEPWIAHSDLRGIIYMPLKDFMDEEPKCYIRRHKDQTELLPVVEAIDTYAGKGNPYPVMNFGVLGLLLIGNMVLKDTLKNKIYYDFALLVGLKIIKEINEHKYPGKDAMTCSQFVSQCYTDAGETYDIKFEKLLLQFKQSNALDNQANLLDYINTADENEIITDEEINNILNNEENIAADFIGLMQNDIDANRPVELVSESKLSRVGKKLLFALYEAFTGKKTSSVAEAVETFSSNRNYFVTPDDLLTNTTNLDEKGSFDKKIFTK